MKWRWTEAVFSANVPSGSENCYSFTPQQLLFFILNKASPHGTRVFWPWGAKFDQQTFCNPHMQWLWNLAYFLLGFTFPEGQKKANKERRSCFSSRLAEHVSVCGGWRGAGALCAGVGFGWREVLFAPLTDPQGRHCCVLFSVSGSRSLFLHLLTQLVWDEMNTVQLVTSYTHAHDIAAMSRWSRCSAAERYRRMLMHLTLMTNRWWIERERERESERDRERERERDR